MKKNPPRIANKKTKSRIVGVAENTTYGKSSLPSEPTEILFRQCAIEWENGNYFFVMELLKKNIPIAAPPFTMKEFLETPVHDVFEVRAANALHSFGYATVADLQGATVAKLLEIPNINQMSLRQVQDKLWRLRQQVVEE